MRSPSKNKWQVLTPVLALACTPTTVDRPTPELVINELLGDNLHDSTDDHGAPSDWLELYNPTDTEVDLDGWTLSDVPADAGRHVLPDGLRIEAGGHLVLWADGAPDRGDRHLAFKLDRDGEALLLSAPDGAIVDQVVFGALPTDMAFARAPDGADAWIATGSPTPDAPNGDRTPWDATRTDGDEPEQLPDREGDEAEVLFSGLIHLGLELDADSLSALADDPYTWVEGALTYRDLRLEPVAVRLKGDTSFQPIDRKPSFKIKLDKYDPDLELYGRRELTLNNMSFDITMLHERLAYQAWRWMGQPAARCGHANLSLNGEPYGIYAHVETVDEELLRQHFEDEDGALFEVWGVEFIDADIPRFELESGPDDRTRLQAVADALELEGDAAMTQVEDALDLDQFLAYWALSAVVGQRDGYPYVEVDDDAHVYDDPGRQRLVFLPHGLDEAFSTGNITTVHGLLASRCLESETCAERWRDEVWRTSDAIDTDLIDLHAELVTQLQPWVEADENQVWEPQAVFDAQELLGDWIRDRPQKLETYIDR